MASSRDPSISVITSFWIIDVIGAIPMRSDRERAKGGGASFPTSDGGTRVHMLVGNVLDHNPTTRYLSA